MLKIKGLTDDKTMVRSRRYDILYTNVISYSETGNAITYHAEVGR